jgi:cytochrome c-type biogenesis protein CcmH
MTPKAQALHKQLRELRAQHAAGSLTDEQFNTRRTQLERQILDHLDQTHEDQPAAGAASSPRRRIGVQTWALLGVFMLVVAFGGYSLTGSPDKINPLPGEYSDGAAPAAGQEPPPHEMGSEQMAALVERLAERMKANPQDAEGWVMLGRSYAAMGRAEDALMALDKAVKLQPEEATILADYADALAVRNGRTLDGEPMQFIERALKADPNHVKALVLAGTAHFNRGDYAGAVRFWDRVAQVGSPDHPLVPVAADGAAEARARGKLPAASAAAAPAASCACRRHGRPSCGTGGRQRQRHGHDRPRPAGQGLAGRRRLHRCTCRRRLAHAAGAVAQAGEGPAGDLHPGRQHGHVTGGQAVGRAEDRGGRPCQQVRPGHAAAGRPGGHQRARGPRGAKGVKVQISGVVK